MQAAARAERIGAMLTTEMGKTLKAAVAEARKCAAACRFYAEHAARFLADRRPADPAGMGASDTYVRYQPLGPVLAVMPWNFPLVKRSGYGRELSADGLRAFCNAKTVWVG